MSLFNRDKTGDDNSSEKPTPTAQPKPTKTIASSYVSPSHSTQSTLLSADVTVRGDVTSKGEIQIRGKVEGDVTCASLAIEEGGSITGNVTAEHVKIRGQVMGTVRGLKVDLQATAHIEGDVNYKLLGMEQGAFFEGRCRRSDDPTAISPKAPAMSSGVKSGALWKKSTP